MQVQLSLDDVYELSFKALTGCGATEKNAAPVAESIQLAEADGIRNVGLNYLSHYCEHLLCGKVIGNVDSTWEQTAKSVIVSDAHYGFAHSAFMDVFDNFTALIQENGSASLAIRNSYAAGVIGWYVEKIADKSFIALAFANSPPAIAPWGGTTAFFGTNPLAFSVPRPGKPPLIIDQSSSTTAKVNVVHAAQRGEPIPDHWTFDREGKPTTDAKEGLAGSMTPSGGYKGVAMAMIVDLMAGGLAGPCMSHTAASFGDNLGGPPKVGQFIIGFDPGAFDSEFSARAEGMFSAMCSQPNVRLPGTRRHDHRKLAEKEGVSLPEKLHKKLLAYARKQANFKVFDSRAYPKNA